MLEMKLVSKRFGKIDPYSIDDFIKTNGYLTLKKALDSNRLDLLDEIESSKLRGRGGAGFPVSIKMMALAKECSQPKYIICNADEGEPGNFKDRYILENDPHQIIEGMLIAAYITNSKMGYIYIRGEYNLQIEIMKNAINQAKDNGYLGEHILKSDFSFELEVRSGAGSYVCGEEFSLVESLEGKAGRTRVKPPFPTSRGLFNKPTLINNVETFATLPIIIDIGGEEYAKIGTASSTGTKLISISGNALKKGVYEVPFGISMRKIINELGGGVEKGRKIRMVQLGGACGPIIPEYMLDMVIDFERFEEFESKTGAGALIVIDDRFDFFEILKRISEFFTHESCGKCIPCREGNFHLIKIIDRFVNYNASEKDMNLLENTALVLHQTSLCGLGQSAPTAIISALHYFRGTFQKRIEDSLSKEELNNA